LQNNKAPHFLASLLQAYQPEVVKLPVSMMVLPVSMMVLLVDIMVLPVSLMVLSVSMMVLSADCETVRMQEDGLTIHAGGHLLVKLVHHARAL